MPHGSHINHFTSNEHAHINWGYLAIFMCVFYFLSFSSSARAASPYDKMGQSKASTTKNVQSPSAFQQDRSSEFLGHLKQIKALLAYSPRDIFAFSSAAPTELSNQASEEAFSMTYLRDYFFIFISSFQTYLEKNKDADLNWQFGDITHELALNEIGFSFTDLPKNEAVWEAKDRLIKAIENAPLDKPLVLVSHGGGGALVSKLISLSDENSENDNYLNWFQRGISQRVTAWLAIDYPWNGFAAEALKSLKNEELQYELSPAGMRGMHYADSGQLSSNMETFLSNQGPLILQVNSQEHLAGQQENIPQAPDINLPDVEAWDLIWPRHRDPDFSAVPYFLSFFELLLNAPAQEEAPLS